MDSPDSRPVAPRTGPRTWTLPLLLGLWTVLVILALWCLFRLSGQMASAPPVVVHAGDPTQISLGQRMREWLMLAHLNFARIYPWILFAPYVLWFSSKFALEGERLKLRLVVLLTGCAGFALGTHAINARVSIARTRVVLFSSEQTTGFGEDAPRHSKMMKVEVTGASAGAVIASDELISSHVGGRTGFVGRADFTNGVAADLLPKLEAAMKPPSGRVSGFNISPVSTLMDVMAYSSLAGLAHAVLFYRRYRERERRALALESSLTKARLNALQAQLQPHFLFNTLNAIATLLRRDPSAAEATLLSLSELLRLSLCQPESQEIPLREELQFLERYLEIQRTRFGDRLRIQEEVDPATLDCLVPRLILQPVVENAIRHGLEPSDAAGEIRIEASQQERTDSSITAGPSLVLKVADNGVGLGEQQNKTCGNGIGLSNLRTRLQTLYGSKQTLQVLPNPDRGVIVRIELPWRAAGHDINGSAASLKCASS